MHQKIIKPLALGITLAGSCVTAAEQVTDAIAPEATSAVQATSEVMAAHYIVAAAHPLASKAGYRVLQQGGSAIDAMVAVQTVLGLVEPQSSGLGGGAFLVYYDAESGKLTTFDGRETAPLAVTPELFLKDDQPLKFYDAVVGGRSVGTPGTVKLLGDTHAKFGKLAWSDLLAPAAELARKGFTVSERLASSIAKDRDRLYRYPTTRAYFFNADGSPLQTGQTLKNEAYAATLDTLATKGADAFYVGSIAEDIVATVTGAEGNPGVLALQDFSVYRIKERAPVCGGFMSYEVCGMGPPSSGALTVGQILGIADQFRMQQRSADDPISWQIIGDASRLAFADRGRYMADTDYVPMPSGLLDEGYLKSRARLIKPGEALSEVDPGEPSWENTVSLADDESIELPSTSHFVIRDAKGNIVSMTTTIENGFGSRLMSNGFLLNNELTDFSFRAHKDGLPIANRVEPGKRPRSSMSPTIVMKDGIPYMAVGSPGGSRIIGYVSSALIRHLAWGESLDSAFNSPHAVNRFGTYDVELGAQSDGLATSLEGMGFKVNRRDLNSGLHGFVIKPDGIMVGAADKRREGVVLGD